MSDARTQFLEGVAAKTTVLEAARRLLESDPAGAEPTLRRIAHALRATGSPGFPSVGAAAADVEAADPADLSARVDRLLSALADVRAADHFDMTCVLIVDDDPELVVLLKKRLAAPNRTVLVAGSAGEAERVVDEHAVGLIVLDLVLPDADGRAVLMRLRENPATASIPVVVLGASSHAPVKAECSALGADDFFEKPLDLDALAATVAARIGEAAHRRRDARLDPLTGVANRAAFEEEFARLQSLAARTGAPLSMAYLDLDRFKEVNDAHGHLVGDQALRSAAVILSRAVRASDLVARWGGDEFVLLFPNTSAAGAVEAVRKLLNAIADAPLSLPGGRLLRLTASAGVVPVLPGTRRDDALAQADRLLYSAKTSGRSRVAAPGDDGAHPPRDVLIAADDPITADILAWAFHEHGFGVKRFSDGRAAYDALRAAPAALVVLDARMTRMDGFELLDALRNLPALSRIPVLMLTELGDDREIARAFERGADDYIVKPLSTVELLARARRLLRRA